jgi:hypothetical protein
MRKNLLSVTNQPSYQRALVKALESYSVNDDDSQKFHDFCLGHLIGWVNSKQDTFDILDSIASESGNQNFASVRNEDDDGSINDK